MKLQGKWLWRGALTLLALALAWLWLRPTPVTTLTLAAQPVQRSVVATGRVEAIRESVLGSTVTARVVATPVKQGAHVAAGATLLLLESDELLALRAQAEAQLRDADSQLSEARRQWQRQQALFAQGFISQAALDAARRTLDAAEQAFLDAYADKANGAGPGSGRPHSAPPRDEPEEPPTTRVTDIPLD